MRTSAAVALLTCGHLEYLLLFGAPGDNVELLDLRAVTVSHTISTRERTAALGKTAHLSLSQETTGAASKDW